MKTKSLSRLGIVLVISFTMVFAGTVPVSGADNLKGATAVLQIVAEQSGKKTEAAKPSEAGKLRADLEAFSKASVTLAPDDAAKQWIALADRFFALPPQVRPRHEDGEPLSAEQLIGALPPPTVWDALAKSVNGRPPPRKENEIRETGLRLLVAALINDKALRDREIQTLQARAENASRSEVYLLRSLFEQLNEMLLQSMDDPDMVLKSLEHRLARSSNERSQNQLSLPNLVTLVGEEKASVFLRKALTNANVTLDIEEANATSHLAQRLALELVAHLKVPQWGLVNSLDALDLFEALDKKFAKPKAAAPQPVVPDLLDVPSDDSGDYARSEAETYYFLGLISKGRAKDAVAVAQKLAKGDRPSLPDDALKAMERAGYTRALDDFFFELLTQDSSLPFWGEYVQLAAKAGRTERMLRLARAAAADENITRKKRSSIHQNLFRALLADEQVDEGVAEIKRLLALEPAAASGTEISHGQLGLMLAKLGVLLKKTEWTDDGIKAARSSLTNAPEGRRDWSARIVPAGLAELLFEQNRTAEAETILTEALASATRPSQGRDEMSFGDGGSVRPILVALASLYHRANRPADVMALLDNAPYWGAKDIADLLEDFSGMGRAFFSMRMHVRDGGESLPLPYMAASALAALNKTGEARTLNDAVLGLYPGYDRAFELFLKLSGENSIAQLDEIFARDQFEERPLIWKARVLADRKDFANAEEVVRRAISIDPSDGEQGPGDRMRAYAVLADIREARGDQKDAAFFRGAVKAIRMSEEADGYYAAGLLKRAVSMYTESLKLFSDAYCIQSRLAIQLAELGLHDEAEAHYRRAYELMPDSFGRVESHCFGCERAFDGARAQSLAEKVFTELAAKQPKKPQVHYLLGYLRAEQDRHAEAWPHFKTAVSLDPEYLNAWQKLLEASSHVRVPAQERDAIVFNLLRLDPMQRHAHADLRHVTDLRGLWNAIDAANKLKPARPTSLYTLAASKAALEKQQAPGNNRLGRSRYASYSLFSMRGDSQTPGSAVAQTVFVQSAAQLLNYVSYEHQ